MFPHVDHLQQSWWEFGLLPQCFGICRSSRSDSGSFGPNCRCLARTPQDNWGATRPNSSNNWQKNDSQDEWHDTKYSHTHKATFSAIILMLTTYYWRIYIKKIIIIRLDAIFLNWLVSMLGIAEVTVWHYYCFNDSALLFYTLFLYILSVVKAEFGVSELCLVPTLAANIPRIGVWELGNSHTPILGPRHASWCHKCMSY